MMKSESTDLLSQARVMAATGKCIEAIAQLDAEERQRVVFGLVITTLGDSAQDKRVVAGIIDRMSAEMKR